MNNKSYDNKLKKFVTLSLTKQNAWKVNGFDKKQTDFNQIMQQQTNENLTENDKILKL